jgi:hypothetical protein
MVCWPGPQHSRRHTGWHGSQFSFQKHYAPAASIGTQTRRPLKTRPVFVAANRSFGELLQCALRPGFLKFTGPEDKGIDIGANQGRLEIGIRPIGLEKRIAIHRAME